MVGFNVVFSSVFFEKMAKNLKELGVDIDAIAKSSGLTEEQIKAL